jgi:phi13 family phage major tail protein
MEEEIVEYRGVEDLVAAEVLSDNNAVEEGYQTGEVFSIAGVAEISKSTSSSNESHYYNNMPAVVVSSTGADEVTLSVSAIPLETLAKITGQKYDELTGALIEGERETKYFAIGYKTKKTNGDYVYVWRLKGTFNIPESTHATENDGTDANGQELTYTGINTTHKFEKVTDKNGNKKGAKAINVDVAKGLADVSTFFDEVTTPDTLQAKA